jgi:aspartate-semialdehyde dehydrogenase
MKNDATSSSPVIAIVGATGLVGGEMMTCLTEKKIDCKEVRLLASSDSAGELFSVCGQEFEVQTLDDDSFRGVDYALFATSSELAERFVPIAVEAGARVIDNSSRFRMEPNIPLVVPEVNAYSIAKSAIIANPNCSTIQLVPVLKVLHECFGLKRVVVSTYQSVSGAGKVALDELWSQTLAVFNQKEIEHDAFQHQIAFNCIPQIDVLQDDGYTKEEMKIINESRKILNIPNLRITATAVRVPVFHSHAESVNVETERPVSLDAAKEKLHAAGIIMSVDGEYPMQLEVAGRDEVHVGRMRLDSSVEHGLNLWVVADNIRKGAALNAVQILEYLLQQTH